MRPFLAFVGGGLLYGLPPEVVNQLYVRRSARGFLGACLSYALLLLVLFALRRFYNRLCKGPKSNLLLWYASLGLIGLFVVEWRLLGNAGAAWYGQVAMFTFWGGLATVPVFMTEDLVPQDLRTRTFRYLAGWYLTILSVGAFSPNLGLLLWVLGSCGLNYFFWQTFRRAGTPDQDGRRPLNATS